MSLKTLALICRNSQILSKCPAFVCVQRKNVHDYASTAMPEIEEVGSMSDKKRKWLTYNDKIFPPQVENEPRRPAYVCHWRDNIKYSPQKLWYIACLVRGMSVEEAIRQLGFVYKKGALPIKETILEARDLAIKNHNVEFHTNLWVAESFVSKGQVVKGMRRHARGRVGEVVYKYSHYYVRLEEGSPPAQYYLTPPSDKASLLEKYMDEMRNRRVKNSL